MYRLMYGYGDKSVVCIGIPENNVQVWMFVVATLYSTVITSLHNCGVYNKYI